MDTGSDKSVLRSDIHEKYFKHISNDKIMLRVHGLNKLEMMGYFKKQLMVNVEEIFLTLHVIPQEVSNFKAIVGHDLLESADISVINGSILVNKK